LGEKRGILNFFILHAPRNSSHINHFLLHRPAGTGDADGLSVLGNYNYATECQDGAVDVLQPHHYTAAGHEGEGAEPIE
jgi:hypothetical protein